MTAATAKEFNPFDLTAEQSAFYAERSETRAKIDILTLIRQEVAAGNITPEEVLLLVTREVRG